MTRRVYLRSVSAADRHWRQKRAEGAFRIQPLSGPVIPVAVGAYFSFNWFSPFSLAVLSVTKAAWSHCGLLFRVLDGETYNVVVYEARWPHVIGPVCFDDVYEAYAKKWCRFAVRWLTLSDMATPLELAENAASYKKAYSVQQLLDIWLYVRFGKKPPERGADAYTCSEFVARCLPEIPFYSRAPTLDAITPGQAYEAIQEYIWQTSHK